MRYNSGNKIKKPSKLLEGEVRKKEEELAKIREMLTLKNKKEEMEINQVLNKNSKKSGRLTPMLLNSERNKVLSRESESDLNKKKIQLGLREENISNNSNKKSSQIKTMSLNNSKSTGVYRNLEDNKKENSILDDQKFRKTFIKSEKIEIDCESINNSMMSRSMINFDDDYVENSSKPSEDKFNKMVRDQLIHEYYEVNDFLDSLNLNKHIEIFIQNGYVTSEKIINEMNEDKLKEMEIPYGHRMKILKKIKNVNGLNVTNVEQENDVYNEIGSGDRNRNEYDQLEADEREQRRLFQLAVEEFRKGNETHADSDEHNPPELLENKNCLDNKQGENPNEKINTNPSSFLYQIGDNNFDFNNIRLFENKGNEVQTENYNDGIDTNIKNFLPITKPKTLCWICYRIILLEASLRYCKREESRDDSNKQFCSKECLDKYSEEFFIKCDDIDCVARIEKSSCIFYESLKLCSDKCLIKNKGVETDNSLNTKIILASEINQNLVSNIKKEEYTDAYDKSEKFEYDPLYDF